MNKKKLQEKYTLIAKIIPAIETTTNIEKVVGFYTYKIEQEGVKEKLEQWIEYLNTKNTLYAVSAINKLKRTSQEEKEKLINLILAKIKSLPEDRYKWQVLMNAFLNLGLYDEACKLYKYISFISQEEIKENLENIDKIKSVMQLDYIAKEYLDNAKEYFKIENNIEQECAELKQIVNDYVECIKEKKEEAINFIMQLYNYLKDKEDILGPQYSTINRLIDVTEDDFIIHSWALVKIKNYILKKQSDDEVSNQIVERLYNDYKTTLIITNEKERIKKHARRLYKEKLKQIIPEFFHIKEIGEFYLSLFNYNITERFLRDSNYDLIFKFLEILLEYNNYSASEIKPARFKLAPKQKNKENIKKIVGKFIEKDDLKGGLIFLEEINAKKLLDFLPNNSASYYIDKLNKNDDYDVYNLQKRLFCEEKNSENIETLKQWLKYVESSKEKSNDLVKHELLTILEMKKEDADIFEKDEEVRKKLKHIDEYCRENVIDIRTKRICELFIDLFNNILNSDDTVQEKAYKIKQFKGINPFRYDKEVVVLPHFQKTSEYSTLKVRSKLAFKKILEKITENDINDYIYIYMNTNVKYAIPIDALFEMLNSTGYRNIEEYFKDYWFYGKITKIAQKYGYRIELLNVLNFDRFKIKLNTYNSIINKQRYKGIIKGYDNANNGILFDEITIVKKEEDAETFNIYKQYFESNDETLLKYINENFLENNLEEVIDFQLNNMSSLNYTNPRLLKDIVNPYRYYNYEDIIDEFKKIENKDFINKMKSLKERTITFKDKYYAKVKELYKKYLNKNDVSKIIIFYMNSFIKYIVDFDEFLEDLLSCYTDEKELNLLVRHLKKYDLIFENCQEYNRVNNILQITSNNIKIENNNSKIDIGNFLSLYGGNINRIEGKTLFIGEIFYVNLKNNSKEYGDLLSVFDQYLKTNDLKYINKLKDLEQIPEFSNYINLRNVYINVLIDDYNKKYTEIISRLLNNIDDLILFIDCLGNNNAYKYIEIYNRYVRSNDLQKKLKNQFIKMCRTEDLKKISYIYNNTFFRNLIAFDELFKIIFRINNQHEKIVNKEGIIDLKDYNFKLYGKIKRLENDVFIHKGYKYVRFKMNNVKDEELVNNNTLVLQKYSVIDNAITAELDKSNSEEMKYNICQIGLLEKIFENNYSVEDVYCIIEDPYIIRQNIYYDEFVKKEYVTVFNKDYTKKGKIETKDLEDLFSRWLLQRLKEKKLKKRIGKIIEIYDKTVLRYVIPLGKFYELIQKNTNIEFDFKCDIRIIRKNEYEQQYYINFLRYRYNCSSIINNLESIKDIEIKETMKFRVCIKNYNVKEDIFLIDILEDEEV